MSKLDWNSYDVKVWRKEAAKTQKRYAELFIDEHETWDGYVEFDGEKDLLKLKIGFALFGTSKVSVNEKFDSIQKYKYNEKQEEAIKIISDVIYKIGYWDNVKFACIFLICYTENGSIQYPLFRILNRDLEPRFVDIEGRVYKHWSDFVENNKLPECIYCSPKSGVYRYDPIRQVFLDFEESPECKIGKKVLVGLDRFSIGASLGSAGLLMGSALTLPISGPVVLAAAATGAACGMWSTGRAIDKLVDRSKHKQDIGLKSAEGRGCWLDISTGIMGTCSMGLAGAAKVAKTGSKISKVIRIASIAGEISTMTIAGASVANHIYEIIDKKNFTRTDVMNLAVAVFFFTNSIVNIKTSIKILQEEGIYKVNTVPRNWLSNNDSTSSSNKNISQRPRYLSSFDDIKALLSKFYDYTQAFINGYDYVSQSIKGSPKEMTIRNVKGYNCNSSIRWTKETLKHKINDILDYSHHQIMPSTGLYREMLFENVDSSDLNDMLNSLAHIDLVRIDAMLLTLVDVLVKYEGLGDIKRLSDSLVSYIMIACRLISVTNDYSNEKLISFLILMFHSRNISLDGIDFSYDDIGCTICGKMRNAMSVEFLSKVYTKGYRFLHYSDIFRNSKYEVSRFIAICRLRLAAGELDEILNLVIDLIRQYVSPNMKRNGNDLIVNALKLVISITSVYSTLDPSKIISLKDLINHF